MHQRTILITLAGLDIGGTETHAVVLCKNLVNLGYKVIVASSGGIYVKEITDYGIPHYNIKLNTKKPLEVIKAIISLKRIIKSEQVGLIHAHARIPAFICNIVSKLSCVHFMTTAHAKFRTNFALRIVSAWGEKTIAVSEDIKEHLIKSFKVKEENITVITNGIDIKQFSSNIGYQTLIDEFKIEPSLKRIVWISRIDDDLSNTITSLIDSVTLLVKEFNFVLLIIGSGNKLEEIKLKSIEKNREIGKEIIKVVGRRTDINLFLNLCDIFIGISRAALEAMACEKPVIIAGPWSFVGIVNENNMQTMTCDNFTGRNSTQQVTKELLAEAISKVLNMPDSEKDLLGKSGRKLVLESYSSTNMVNETLKVYQAILSK